MTWTAKLDAVEKDPTNGNIIASVTFTDGKLTVKTNDIRGNDLTIGTIAQISALRIKAFEERDTAFDVLKTQLGDVPIVAIPALDALQLALQKLSLLKQKIELGVKRVDDADYVAALDNAKQLQALADQ